MDGTRKRRRSFVWIAWLTLALMATACGSRGITVKSSGQAPTDQHTTRQISWPALDQWRRTDEAPTDVAVIVAIEDYAFLPDVAGARRNAAAWEAWFASRGMDEIFVLSDANAAAEEMLRYAEVATQAATRDSRIWYVFIGHGAPATGGEDGVLVGMDARQTPDSLTARGVRQQELIDRLERGPQAQTVVVVDACFSGRSPAGDALARGTQPVVPVAPTTQVSDGTVILTAAQADQFAGALPGADRPAYSYLLLGALRGWADDGDGEVTAGAAHDYVLRQLRRVTGRTQTPGLDGASELLLTSSAGEPDPGIADRLRQAAAGPVAVEGSGVRIDTGAGVVVTQLEGWTPIDPEGGLVSFRNPETNGGRWILFGWRDPDGQADQWITQFHDHLAKLEEQIRPTQVVRYGDVSTFETSYRANFEGHEVTVHVWDIKRPGAFYRATGLSFNSDRYGAEDYAGFQRFVKLLQFGSATNAPRLRAGPPGLPGKISRPKPERTTNSR